MGFMTNKDELLKPSDLRIGLPVVHVKTGGKYEIIGFASMKIDNSWHDIVIYESLSGKTYSRKISDFLLKFEK